MGRSIRPPSCETAHRRCSSGSPKLFRRRLVRDKDGDGSLRHPPRTWRYHYARHFLCGWRSAIRSGTGAVWTDGADAGARSRFPVDYLKGSYRITKGIHEQVAGEKQVILSGSSFTSRSNFVFRFSLIENSRPHPPCLEYWGAKSGCRHDVDIQLT